MFIAITPRAAASRIRELEKIRAEYNEKIQENTRKLLYCFCAWLLVLFYVVADSGTEHVAGFFILSALGTGIGYAFFAALDACGYD